MSLYHFVICNMSFLRVEKSIIGRFVEKFDLFTVVTGGKSKLKKKHKKIPLKTINSDFYTKSYDCQMLCWVVGDVQYVILGNFLIFHVRTGWKNQVFKKF